MILFSCHLDKPCACSKKRRVLCNHKEKDWEGSQDPPVIALDSFMRDKSDGKCIKAPSWPERRQRIRTGCLV
ncbi:hypothetical protein XENTR_v10002766 [Xenopus tropicalis]|nr:hypothetical protein XENTR_v10002766 [Xenopus tropicalis]